MSESEKRWQAACFFCCLPPDIRGGGGVAAWRSSYCEHDPGWRSAAADADDLCHWGGFQDSALTAALTSQGKHTHQRKHTHTSTRTHQINTSRSHTAWVRRPSMTHFDYSVLKQQVTGLPRMSSVRLASVQRRQFRIHGEQQAGKMPDLQVSCPIIDIKWAQDVMSSSRKSSIPLSGWIKLSVAAEGQISVAGHTLPPGGNVWKKITHGTLACLIQAAILIPIKAIKAQLIKTIRNRCACMCAQWFPWLPIYIFLVSIYSLYAFHRTGNCNLFLFWVQSSRDIILHMYLCRANSHRVHRGPLLTWGIRLCLCPLKLNVHLRYHIK